MHRYSPVRNPRSKGIKIKHVLRICFLISVCCWLIFQIKRSHYKRNGLESVNSDIKSVSRKHSVSEVVKLGRKDVRVKETATREEEEDEEEKDDEIDENEQYKFDDEEEMVNESETANEAREEHYKADDASSAVTDGNEPTLDTTKFLEHENQVDNGAKVQETGSESANVSSDHSRYGSNSTQVVEESETLLKSTNGSAVVDLETILTAKEDETEEDLDEVQHDAIDSTDIIGLEELDNSEDTVAE